MNACGTVRRGGSDVVARDRCVSHPTVTVRPVGGRSARMLLRTTCHSVSLCRHLKRTDPDAESCSRIAVRLLPVGFRGAGTASAFVRFSYSPSVSIFSALKETLKSLILAERGIRHKFDTKSLNPLFSSTSGVARVPVSVYRFSACATSKDDAKLGSQESPYLNTSAPPWAATKSSARSARATSP